MVRKPPACSARGCGMNTPIIHTSSSSIFPAADLAAYQDERCSERVYDTLKAEYMRLNPNCSIEQHTAAMERFALMAGL